MSKIDWDKTHETTNRGTDGLGVIARYEVRGERGSLVKLGFTCTTELSLGRNALPDMCAEIADIIHKYLG